MLRITVSKVGEPPRTATFDKREISVGRTPANDLMIPEPGVSSAHARILFSGSDITVVDLESTNGTFVNGTRIQGPHLLSTGAEVFICAHRLEFEILSAGQVADSASLSYGAQAPGPAAPPDIFGTPEIVAPPEAAPDFPDPVPHEPSQILPRADLPAPQQAPELGPPHLPGRPSPKPTPEAQPTFPPPLNVVHAEPAGSPSEQLAAPRTNDGFSAHRGAPDPVAPPSFVPAPDDPLARADAEPQPPGPPAPLQAPAPVVDQPPAVAFHEPAQAPPAPAELAPPAYPLQNRGPLPRPGTLSPVVPAPPRLRSTPSAAGVAEHRLEAPARAHRNPSRTSPGQAARAQVFAGVYETFAHSGELPPSDDDVKQEAQAQAQAQLSEHAARDPTVTLGDWPERIANELCGLGPLAPVLADPATHEVFIHGPDRVTVRRNNEPNTTMSPAFSCPQAVELVIQRLTGTYFGPETPIIDTRTAEGADIYAVHDSVASDGPVATIVPGTTVTPPSNLEALLQAGWVSPALANLLAVCVQAGVNILVCSGAGAQAFPLMAALIDATPDAERQVLVRPHSEPGALPERLIVLQGDGLVGNEGTTVMQALVRSALGLRPDRLAIHELAGPEAAEAMAAAGRGLSGVLLSTRASSPHDALVRLASLVGLAGGHGDANARFQYVAGSVQLVVALARFPDGRMRVVEVAEARVSSSLQASTQEIIRFDPQAGLWRHSGAVPGFFADLQRRGIAADVAMLGG